MPKFKLTDGRPWYKQGITGIFIFIELSLLAFIMIAFILFGVTITTTVVEECTTEIVFDTIFYGVCVTFTVIVVIFSILLYEWAKRID